MPTHEVSDSTTAALASQPSVPREPRRPRWYRQLVDAIVALTIATSFLMSLRNLDHSSFKGLDESFHVIVARNLSQDLSTPILYREPFLPPEGVRWMREHVWLHKPPLAIYQSAISMKLLGPTPYNARLPSAILAALAAWVTYRIGLRLTDVPEAAALPAIAQAFLPAIHMLVHGYAFSDMVDVSILFWIEVGMLFLLRAMTTNRRSDWIICGVAQGLAWLSKSHPALIVTGVAVALWLINLMRQRWQAAPASGAPEVRPTSADAIDRGPDTISGRGILLILAATLATALPWVTYCLIRFPAEWLRAEFHTLAHLSNNVENFAAPWDRLLFHYQPQLAIYLYPVGLTALVICAREAIKHRRALALFPVLWWAGFVTPHVLAATKTPSQTLPAVPGMLLAITVSLTRAYRGDRFAMLAITTAALLPVFWRPSLGTGALGYPAGYTFGSIAQENLWMIIQPAISVCAGWLGSALRVPRLSVARMRRVGRIAGVVAAGLLLWISISIGARWCWKVSAMNIRADDLVALGQVIKTRLPPNAVILLEPRPKGPKMEEMTLMFYAQRNVYAVSDEHVHAVASQVRNAGGVPFRASTAGLFEIR